MLGRRLTLQPWCCLTEIKNIFSTNTRTPIMKKSFEKYNPILAYCESMSTPLHPALMDLQKETLSLGNCVMMAAPEVISLNMFLIKAIQARKVLDVGVFTGSSSLAAALAVGEGGKVIALEKSRKYTETARKYWAVAGVEDRIDLKIGPAIEYLEEMLITGQQGAVDFAFIDADKGNYIEYYKMCLQLVRKGGIVAMDNTLFKGKVVDQFCQEKTVQQIQEANEFVRNDDAADVLMLSVGDGYTMAIKK